MTMINLQNFYPKELQIQEIIEEEKRIIIKMNSQTTESRCVKCQEISRKQRGRYIRTVQDLPILNKQTKLKIEAHEYICDNPNCSATTFVETIDGFTGYYSRMTKRCEDFICALALETSCEGCARICKMMNLVVSADTVIRILLKKYAEQPTLTCGEIIGVDDFAFKKRNDYGTVIVDEKTHRPVAILDGRDGKTLKEWLESNKHVTTVTRDRASAYASAIKEVLPAAMQVADRFHLHQNVLEAVKTALYSNVPVHIKIQKEGNHSEEDDDCFKKRQ